MAEYVYTADNFNLTSTITFGDFGSEVTYLSGASKTIAFGTSRLQLAAGEVIRSVVLTGSFSITGGYSYTVHANGEGFYNGTLNLDPAAYVAGQDWSVLIYFILDRVAPGDGS